MGRSIASLALAAAAVLACGARSYLPVGDAGVVDAPVDSPPETDAPVCVGTSVPVFPNIPDLYFVLDASGSMAQDSKWANMRTVISSLIFELGPSARFGATVFPGPNADTCASGAEVMPLTRGDILGQTAQTFLSATALTPRGGTPTAATFRALAPRFSGMPTAGMKSTFFILATDGGPNCSTDPTLTCDLDHCTRNIDGVQGCAPGLPPNCCIGATAPQGCLDGPATIAAISDVSALGIKTFVLGIPGSLPYADVLDQAATVGGTARPSEPLYYRVDSSDTTALASALGEIAAQTMKSCVLTLEQTPGDPSKLNVYLGGVLVPADGPDGWQVDGRTVTLEGASCGSLQADAGVPMVTVISGCPTVH